MDITSSLSSPSDDAITAVTCTNPSYSTLVSCGFRAATSNDGNVDGGWMSTDGTICYAQNGLGGNGVYAVARYAIYDIFQVSR